MHNKPKSERLTVPDKVLNFNEYMLYEAENASRQFGPEDEADVKLIIKRLIYGDPVGIFSTGKYGRVGGGQEEEAQETVQPEAQEGQADDELTVRSAAVQGAQAGSTETSEGEQYYSSLDGTVRAKDLRALNNIPEGESLAGKSISKINLRHIMEPYDPREKEAQEKRAAAQKEAVSGTEWAIENMPELAQKMEQFKAELEKRQRYMEEEPGNVKLKERVDQTQLDYRSRIELANFLAAGGGQYINEEDQKTIRSNANGTAIKAVLTRARIAILEQTDKESAEEYARLERMIMQINGMDPESDEFADAYATAYEIPIDRAKAAIDRWMSRASGATKGTKEWDKAVTEIKRGPKAKLNDMKEGLLYIADMMLRTGGEMSQAEVEHTLKLAVEARREEARRSADEEREIGERIMAMSDAERIREYSDATGKSLDDARDAYLENKDSVTSDLISTRIAQMKFKPKKIGNVLFRAKSADAYDSSDIIINIPLAKAERSDPGSARVRYGGKTKKSFEYDPQSGVITLDKPFVIPKNSTVGTTVGGGEIPISFSIIKYDRQTPEKKQFMKSRVVDYSKIDDLIDYQPDNGIPKYVVAYCSMNDWRMTEIGDVVSNAPIHKSQLYSAEEVEGADIITKKDARDKLDQLSVEEFAAAYSSFYRQDYEKTLSLLSPEESNPDLTPEAIAKARKSMTEEMSEDMSGHTDKIHVGLKVVDKQGREKQGMPKVKQTMNYWVRFEVILEDMKAYVEEEKDLLREKSFEDSKKDEVHSSEYKLAMENVKRMSDEQKLAEYIKVTGESEEDARDLMQSMPIDQFEETLAWEIYDLEVVKDYVSAFSTKTRQITEDDARRALAEDRTRAIADLNKKSKAEKTERPVKVGKVAGIDPTSMRYEFEIPAGMSKKEFEAFREMWKASGRSSFMTAADVKKDYLEKDQDGNYVKSDAELAWLYTITFNKEYDREWSPEFQELYQDTLSFLKEYRDNPPSDEKIVAKLEDVLDRESEGDEDTTQMAADMLHNDREAALDKLSEYNRKNIINQIAREASKHEEHRETRRVENAGKLYGKKSNDMAKIREAYGKFKRSIISELDDEDFAEEYSNITGESIDDVEQMLGMLPEFESAGNESIEDAKTRISSLAKYAIENVVQDDRSSISAIKNIVSGANTADGVDEVIEAEANIRELLRKKLEDSLIEYLRTNVPGKADMLDELQANEIDVYEVSDEDMAKDVHKILDMDYEEALAAITSNRQAVIDRIEELTKEKSKSSPYKEEVEKGATKPAYSAAISGRAAGETYSGIEAMKAKLEGMSDEELAAKYKYQYDDELLKPENRQALIDQVLADKKDELRLKFTKSSAAQEELMSKRKETTLKAKVREYVDSANKLPEDQRAQFVEDEIKKAEFLLAEIETDFENIERQNKTRLAAKDGGKLKQEDYDRWYNTEYAPVKKKMEDVGAAISEVQNAEDYAAEIEGLGRIYAIRKEKEV